MAKLKKAPGFLIGRWKKEAIAVNQRASDEDLAKIINETARKQGYDYKITPDKVRTKTTLPATQAVVVQTAGILTDNLQSFVQLVGKEGAKEIVEDIIERL
jgi:hypothetical protein